MENTFYGNMHDQENQIKSNLQDKHDQLIKSESLAKRSNKFNELLTNLERNSLVDQQINRNILANQQNENTVRNGASNILKLRDQLFQENKSQNQTSSISGRTQPKSSDNKYKKRVDEIVLKLNNMQIEIEKEKQIKLIGLDQQLGQTETNLYQWQEDNMKKFNDFKIKVSECLNYIENDKAAQIYEREAHLQEVIEFEKSIEERFQQEKQARKEMEARLLLHIEDKFIQLKKTLSQESRNRYESIEQLKGNLESDIPRIQEAILSEQETRNKKDQEIQNRIDNEIKLCVEAIEQERRQREETEEAVLDVIKEMTSKIKAEIQEEHFERQQNFESLLNLLEDRQIYRL